MIDRSRAWYQHSSAAGVLLALASCSSESIQRQEPLDNDEPGALQGELSVQIADFDDGTTETRYFLRNAEGLEQRLAMQGAMDAAPGKKLKIWGKQRGEVLDVTKYKVVAETAGEGIGSQAQPLVDAAVRPGRVMCAALVNIDGGTARTTLDAVKTSFHTGAKSVNAYYRENSFGQVGLEGDTYGPFPFTGFGSCGTGALTKAIKPMLDSASPVKCDQYAFVFGPGGGCGWSGLAQVGSTDRPQTDTWYADSVSCVVAVQEPGHNYGMLHSSSITCGTAPFADNLASCTHSEYGDKYDTMGGGCYHMNGWQKLYQKWFGGCNGVRTTSSGKFNIYPIETACNGVQVLQVPFPGGKTRAFQGTTLTSYYLELRAPIGIDAKYGPPSVLVHAAVAPILPNTKNPRGVQTWVLAAGGAKTWGLAAGGTFADPAGGLTITVDSVDMTHAVVDINYTAGTGSPVCLDGGDTPFTPPGPTDCNAPPPPPPPMDAGKGGAGGTAGKGGAAGTAGTAGKGGTGGATGGTGGMGGATGGTGGTGGATGGMGGATGGTGGATGGTGGATGGTGGATGGTGGATGGTGGTTGGTGGGSGSSGTGGDAGSSAGSAGTGAKPPPGDPGCGCRITPAPVEQSAIGALFALGLGGLFTARRRSRRKSDR